MKKIEQMYNKLLQRRTHLQNELLNIVNKLKTRENLPNRRILEDDLVVFERQLSLVKEIIKEYKFLYSSEIEVIDSNCLEFRVK